MTYGNLIESQEIDCGFDTNIYRRVSVQFWFMMCFYCSQVNVLMICMDIHRDTNHICFCQNRSNIEKNE